MSIHEPSTLITDLLIAAFAVWLAWRLACRCGHCRCAIEWMARSLWVIAAAAVVGGAFHGFARNFAPEVVTAWWITTLVVTCLAAASLDLTLLHELVAPEAHSKWRVAVVLKFAVFSGAAFRQQEFLVAIIAYGLTLLAWAVAAVVVRRAWSGWMLMGIGVSILAAAAQQLRISPGTHFNHNDLYHALQAVALFGFYRAGRRLRPGARPAGASTAPAV